MSFADFLLNYWWIIFILIIVLAVLIKRVRKVLLFLFIGLLALVLLWQLFVAKGFSQSTACLTNDAQLFTELKETASAMPPGDERDRIVCEESEVITNKLEQCFIRSSRDHKLSFMIYSSLPTLKKFTRESVTNHNLHCPDSQMPYFDFK